MSYNNKNNCSITAELNYLVLVTPGIAPSNSRIYCLSSRIYAYSPWYKPKGYACVLADNGHSHARRDLFGHLWNYITPHRWLWAGNFTFQHQIWTSLLGCFQLSTENVLMAIFEEWCHTLQIVISKSKSL